MFVLCNDSEYYFLNRNNKSNNNELNDILVHYI